MSPEPAKEPQPVKPEPESPDLEDKAANKRRKVCVKISDESADADHENLTMLVATEEAARKNLIYSSDPNIMVTVESRATAGGQVEPTDEPQVDSDMGLSQDTLVMGGAPTESKLVPEVLAPGSAAEQAKTATARSDAEAAVNKVQQLAAHLQQLAAPGSAADQATAAAQARHPSLDLDRSALN